jgi:hypothetical protein
MEPCYKHIFLLSLFVCVYFCLFCLLTLLSSRIANCGL